MAGMRDWERRLLLPILLAVFWILSQHVGRVTPRMPEAAGSREVVCGHGPVCKVLVAGNSCVAGSRCCNTRRGIVWPFSSAPENTIE
jgi:hypothetical protein